LCRNDYKQSEILEFTHTNMKIMLEVKNYKKNKNKKVMLNGFVVILSEKNDRSIGQTLVNISTVDENQQRLINIKEYLKTVNIRINKMLLML